jgi:two-component system invasion response regulator UvrY
MERTETTSAVGVPVGGAPIVTVLIVDDQPLFRSVARMIVARIPGWRILAEADSGEEAVARAAGAGVVLMDINLPGIDGIAATRRILERQPDTAVVLLSTYAAEDLPAEAARCGAVGYLHKDDLTPSLLRELVCGGAGTGISPPTAVP